MATTLSSNLIVPKVYAQALMLDVKQNGVFQQFATIYPELEGTAGDTLSLVAFARLTELSADSAENTALTPETMTATENALTIVEAAKAVEISWRAKQTAFGDPIGVSRQETARVIAARIEDKLRAAAEAAATSRTVTKAATISYAAILEACAPFGDAIVQGGISLIVHSKQLRDIMQDAKFSAPARGDGFGGPGYAGALAGVIPVYVSDRISTIAGTPNTYRAILVQDKPLAYGHKAEPEIAMQDNVLARTTTVVASLLYCTGAMRPERIAALVTQ